jgi:uncharacterized membrane protein
MNNPIRNFCEHLLGLHHGFLSERGDWSVQYNAPWPKLPFLNLGQVNWLLGAAVVVASVYLLFSRRMRTTAMRAARAVAVICGFGVLLMLLSGPVAFNLTLGAVALLLVVYVYSLDGRSTTLRIVLGAMRAVLLGLILFLLNEPVLTVAQSQTEPSVLAVLIDDSGSMRVPDAGDAAHPQTRLSAVQSLLTSGNGSVLKELAEKHNLRLYKFDNNATPIAGIEPPPPVAGEPGHDTAKLTAAEAAQHRHVLAMTLPGTICYFLAFLLLLVATAMSSGKLRIAGIALAGAGLVAQLIGMFMRWSAMHDSSPHGDFQGIIFSNWFGTIAIMALLAVILGLAMEIWRGRGLFGAGAGLVGWVALLVLLAAPYFANSEPEREIRIAKDPDIAPAVAAVNGLEPIGDSTQVLPSILTTLHDLQGQRVAGVVLLTDGRDTPAHNIAEGLDALKDYGVKVFPIAVGSENPPRNIEVQDMELDDVAFKGDIVNVKAMVRASGYEPGHAVHLMLRDKKTGTLLLNKEGKPSETTINVPDDKPVPVELQWQTTDVGTKDVEFVAVKQTGELDDTDNSREALVSVLDAKITVLFVDGYPRWDYRYLKNALLRDKSVEVSCLLASADFNFLQEGNKALPSAGKNVAGHFPDTLEQLMEYDVIVLGDVDPRYFSDNQLQLMNEFVNRGGGFEMVAGERFAPQAYRNTPIEPLLPVTLAHVEQTDPSIPITQGYRPVVTKVGQTTSLFRFFADRIKNEDFISHQIPELFWYCRGVTAKPSVGEVLAEHPTDIGPDGHKAPLLVAGRFGGRTLFSAMDDSWRWRFYTDEPVFDTYWVQQLRYLARNRKIGQRRLTLTADQPVYELGGQVRLMLRVIDPGLARQLPDQIRVQVFDANGQPVRIETLVRQDGSGGETFAGSYTADKVGKFTIHLPPIVTGVDMMETPIEVTLPKLELVDPRVDHLQLTRLAAETLGKPIDLAMAKSELAAIPSVKRDEPKPLGEPLWNAPITMAVFVLLIVGEWVVRKLNGMV